MPSNAYRNFFKTHFNDVLRMIQSYYVLDDVFYNGKKGKRGLDHINRSGIVLLCAGWELYIENLVEETAKLIINEAKHPSNLNKYVKKSILRYLNKKEHEYKMFELAEDGWRKVYLELVDKEIKDFHNPKIGPINEIFTELLGYTDFKELSKNGSIDEFVKFRGEIAHRGTMSEGYVDIENHFIYYFREIVGLIITIDSSMMLFLEKKLKQKPWYNTYKEKVSHVDTAILAAQTQKKQLLKKL